MNLMFNSIHSEFNELFELNEFYELNEFNAFNHLLVYSDVYWYSMCMAGMGAVLLI